MPEVTLEEIDTPVSGGADDAVEMATFRLAVEAIWSEARISQLMVTERIARLKAVHDDPHFLLGPGMKQRILREVRDAQGSGSSRTGQLAPKHH